MIGWREDAEAIQAPSPVKCVRSETAHWPGGHRADLRRGSLREALSPRAELGRLQWDVEPPLANSDDDRLKLRPGIELRHDVLHMRSDRVRADPEEIGNFK